MRGIEGNGSQKNYQSTQISIEKASLIMLLDAAVYLVEDLPVKRGGGIEVVFKKKSGEFVTLQLRENGSVFMSEEY